MKVSNETREQVLKQLISELNKEAWEIQKRINDAVCELINLGE